MYVSYQSYQMYDLICKETYKNNFLAAEVMFEIYINLNTTLNIKYTALLLRKKILF